MAGLDDDPDLKAMAAGLSAPVKDTAPSLDDDPDLKAMQQGFDAPPVKVAPKPSSGSQHAPTRFHKAAQPTADPELTWADTGKQALHNLVPSGIETGKAMVDAVTHPVETVKALGTLGKGFVSQAAGAMGAQQDPEEKARTEAVAKALEDHYGTTYGSVKGFKKAVATDPVSVAMDASTVLGGSGAGAKALGLAKTARVLERASSLVDPVQRTIALARQPGRALSAVGRGVGSVTSGVPDSVLKIATEIGASKNPAMQDAFSKFATGQGDANELATEAHSAMAQIRNDASSEYLKAKGPMLNLPVDLTSTQAALQKAKADLGKGSPLGFKDAKERLAEIQALVDSVATNPDPMARNIDNVDALKQQIYDLHDANKASKAGMVTNNVYHGVKADLVGADPEYAKLMESYGEGLRNTADLTKTLGLKSGSASSATLAKSLKALKTATGQNLLSQLTERNPRIAGMLAGAAINPWSQHNSIWEALAGAGAPALLAHPIGAAAAIPGAAAGFAMSSPRIVGSAANLAGKASRNLDKLKSPQAIWAGRGAYYTGHAQQEDAPKVDATPEDIDKMTRAVAAEAGSQSATGKAAVAHTILNRARQAKEKISSVIDRPYAFEGVGNGNADKIDPQSPVYKAAHDIVMGSLNGELADPTGGAVNFLNKDLQAKLGRPIPKWAQGDGKKIGAHTFYPGQYAAADDSRTHFARGGSVDDKLEFHVKRLMSMAKMAKKHENKGTEPLLKASDDAVVKALAVAQRAI